MVKLQSSHRHISDNPLFQGFVSSLSRTESYWILGLKNCSSALGAIILGLGHNRLAALLAVVISNQWVMTTIITNILDGQFTTHCTFREKGINQE